ncbi:ACT domain-containing protein [Parerythrobacter aestuarii]|uniref:ACT domain-containing protein n=1 Tax=Parerythrobacter aestuarii TaxID=3020909 RepID=UPI0024DE764A|nr:ACT domain-containing protein [Parerythrobacter aestuarii]
MTQPISDTAAMIAGMDPVLDARWWSFVGGEDPDVVFQLMGHALATFREEEGLSLIVPHEVALANEIEADPYSRITLQVHSALAGVGLTAAVSGALAEAGICCNMVAALRHDHAFVPAERADEALALLKKLQHSAR